MKTHEKKFEEIYNLLKEKLCERVIFSQGHETKFLELKDSNFWLSMNKDELTVGFGLNHSHFSEDYNNLENGIIRVFDLLTNQIKQHFAKNLKPQSFQNQGIALFFLYFSQVRGLSRTLK